jgi:hypothetical protein
MPRNSVVGRWGRKGRVERAKTASPVTYRPVGTQTQSCKSRTRGFSFGLRPPWQGAEDYRPIGRQETWPRPSRAGPAPPEPTARRQWRKPGMGNREPSPPLRRGASRSPPPPPRQPPSCCGVPPHPIRRSANAVGIPPPPSAAASRSARRRSGAAVEAVPRPCLHLPPDVSRPWPQNALTEGIE